MRWLRTVTFGLITGGLLPAATTNATAADPPSAKTTAAKVDALLNDAITKSGGKVAGTIDDGEFLRRVSLDLVGRVPSANDVTRFGLDPDSDKRSKAIERLLESEAFARNWARYWRDVIMTRATDQRARLAQRALESWLVEQFKENRSWAAIATELVTATGDVREKGQTGLLFAHGGDAKEVAAETSRIFMGIQIQCANCHNHPTDKWKREQFHQLAAYFPRMRIRPVRSDQNRIRSFELVSAENGRPAFDIGGLMLRYDKNKDGKLTREEVKGSRLERAFGFMLRNADRNRDGAISKQEFERVRQFQQRRQGGGTEYYMPDLNNPGSRGTRMEPVFFVGSVKSGFGKKDVERRKEFAELLTAKDNKWFARAFVNRVWAEMLGEGFYMPVDDLGPQRTARFENVIDLLAKSFAANNYDVKWLYRTVANTEAYQRQIAPRPVETATPFASASPTRLRGDQIYDSLTQALGVRDLSGGPQSFGRRRFGGGGYRGRFGGERFQVTQLFNYDPSKPQADILGTVPQALYMMNSPSIDRQISATGRTRLAGILRDHKDNDAALAELYMAVFSREPSKKERKICSDYIAKVGNRNEAFEDILWSLLNSSEFLTKR